MKQMRFASWILMTLLIVCPILTLSAQPAEMPQSESYQIVPPTHLQNFTILSDGRPVLYFDEIQWIEFSALVRDAIIDIADAAGEAGAQEGYAQGLEKGQARVDRMARIMKIALPVLGGVIVGETLFILISNR